MSPIMYTLIGWMVVAFWADSGGGQPAQPNPAADANPAAVVRQLLDLELFESALSQLASDSPWDAAIHQHLLILAVEGLADDHWLCGNGAQAARRYRWLIDLSDPVPARRRREWQARRTAAVTDPNPTAPGQVEPIPRRQGRWSVVLPGPWRQRHAGRFLIRHHNDFVARRIEEALHFHLDELCNYLSLDPQAVDWPGPVNVYIHADPAALQAALPNAGRAMGRSVIGLQNGQPRQLDLHLTQNAPLLLSSVLPHELAHLLIAHATGYRPLPRYLDEGLALQVEPPAVQLRYDRLESAQVGQRLPAIKSLLQPADPLQALNEGQYTHARLLADFLIERLGLAGLLEICKHQAPTPANLVGAASWTSPNALQRDWQAFVRDRHDHRR